MKRVKHWQDAVNALLGAWLLLCPWVLGFQGVVVATATTMALGALLVASSAGAMQFAQAWEEWLDVLLGVGLMLAPVLLGFDGVALAHQNALVTGALVAALALWVLVTDDDFAAAWQRLVA
ncbi:MAG TPA: SPW repeat protein [Ramlibacter sp.]|jgi:FtsH-binding integral membrane protein|nr:SPW repeat protein [Ramlibacter sp.]